MGEQFAAAVDMPYDEQSTAETMLRLMESADGVLLVGHGGMVGGLVYPAYFNREHRMAQELFWWSETPGVGRALLAGLENWARGVGAKSLTMLAMADLRADAVGRLYRRQGFRPLENTFVKAL
jgi:hypothetical protein